MHFSWRRVVFAVLGVVAAFFLVKFAFPLTFFTILTFRNVPSMRNINLFGLYADQKIVDKGYELANRLEQYYSTYGDYPNASLFEQEFGNSTGFHYVGGFRYFALESDDFLNGQPTNLKVGRLKVEYKREFSTDYRYQITSCDTTKRCALGSIPKDASYVFAARPESINFNFTLPYPNGTRISIPANPATHIEFATRAYGGIWPSTNVMAQQFVNFINFDYDPRYFMRTVATTSAEGYTREKAVFTPTGKTGHTTFSYTQISCDSYPNALCSEAQMRSQKRSYEFELYTSPYMPPTEPLPHRLY